VVPNVYGRTVAKASARITKAHCRVGKITRAFSPWNKRGKVLGEKPKPGSRLGSGAKVKLIVGKGPRK
jgi:beta-lactam-binding protein with PASTA domain